MEMSAAWMLVLVSAALLGGCDAGGGGGGGGTERCTEKVDLTFLVDASSSICDGGDASIKQPPPCPNWYSCLQLMASIVDSMEVISPNDVQVACVVFFNSAEVRWRLNT